MTFIDLLHGFFAFLGTPSGELLKTAVELIFFTIVLYMIVSEWTRSRNREHRFLIIAFSALVLGKIVSVYFLSSFVFTEAPLHFWLLRTFGSVLDISALFLVANAFVYPILIRSRTDTKRFMAERFLLLGAITAVLSFVMFAVIGLSSARVFWIDIGILLGQIVLMFYYSSFIVKSGFNISYRLNLVIAFIVFTVSPFICLVNIMFFSGSNLSLVVASYPFPFVSVMLFTQVIYLKLVDKANLRNQLRVSQERYAHEREVSKLKDEFISTVSHELKTPITSMKLYTGLLRDGRFGSLRNKQKDALGVVSEEAERLNNLITDLLDLSRLESGKSRIDLSEFDLRELVNDKLYVSMAKRKGISVKIDVPRSFVVTADRNKMKQIFVNLFGNAMKFTPEKGRITISARSLETGWDFCVSDNGKGIEKDKISRLFDKFYQADHYMTREKGGVGLGLSIVKGIVELHKGKINVSSELGKGTRICIVFPRLNRY
ncbi:HAMP domain-containing histidine kinase [Candidatus Woesearchaeota archaeon]|nr:HAMP domain-containing histidine kinase [Candidatus Woesearchaeota archaeon]